MLSNRVITLLIGASIGLAFMGSIPQALSGINQVKDRQIEANQRLEEWKAAYQALLPVNDKWERSYISAERTGDMVELYRAFKLDQHGLIVNADEIIQLGNHAVDVQGVQVGLQSLCIGSNNALLKVSAMNISALRSGLRAVAARPDISMGSVRIGFDKNTSQPFAEVTDFCLKVRT